MRRQELLDLGVAQPASAPLLDVVVGTALLTGAAVPRVPDDDEDADVVRNGLGAVLRYTLGGA